MLGAGTRRITVPILISICSYLQAIILIFPNFLEKKGGLLAAL